MTNTISSKYTDNNRSANTALKTAAQFWFITAFIGQWIFIVYVAVYYGGLTLQDGLEGIKNSHLPKGYIAGDTAGNLAIAMHLLIAVLIIGGGSLQLIPQIRSRFPRFHHWNGRIYIVTAMLTSLAGLFLVMTRGSIGSITQNIGISLDGILILIFAVLAMRYAMVRKIDSHRRWALRLFMVVSGVWFFRVGLMLSIALNQGPFGFDPKTFTGPFLDFLSFACYLLPLAVLELYFRAQQSTHTSRKFVMAGSLVIFTLAMGLGIFAAASFMWLPRL